MNKIFKVVWSEARNAYVVVSEIAKNHGSKSCSTKKLVTMLIATGVMTCASMAPAMAANPAPDDANKGWNLSVNGAITAGTEVQPGDYVDFNGDQNVSVSKDAKDGVKAVKVELNKDLVGIESISNGDAKMALNGAAGTAGMINGKGASICMQDGYTVINSKVAFDQNGKISGVAAGVADTDAVNVSQLKAVGATANMGWNLATNGVATEATNVKPGDFVDFSGDKNINVSHDGTKVQVELNKDIDVNSVQTNALNAKYNLSVGTMAENGIMPFFVNSTGDFYAAHNKFHVDKDGKVTATAGEIGNVVLQNGVYYGHSTLQDGSLLLTDDNGNHSYIDAKSAKLGKVTVAEDGKISGVAAGAAALAALHPMDFDPDDKLTFSAGYGNYAGENAAAIGAYYRPDEKVMFSVAGTVGNGENMVNAGVSFALDRTNHVSNSRTALAREVIDLRGQLAVMGAKMAKMEKAFGMLDETKTKLFPDVPANHWAYEYIAKLAGNGYIEGYPDGNFGGDRLMTRYEFAAMLYRAIENGAALEEKIIKEFEPELGRIRVDRISGEDGDRDKIERVRVNDTKGERDHYGNKLAK